MRRAAHRYALTIAAGVLCVVLGGCIGNLPSFGAAGPTASPTPTPEPTPALATLADMYMKYASTLDAARCNYERVVGDPSSSVASLRTVASETANANRYMTNHVAALPWPPSVQGPVQNLIKAIAAVETELRLAADQITRNAVLHHLNDVSVLAPRVSAATEVVHKDLHLPIPVLVCL